MKKINQKKYETLLKDLQKEETHKFTLKGIYNSCEINFKEAAYYYHVGKFTFNQVRKEAKEERDALIIIFKDNRKTYWNYKDAFILRSESAIELTKSLTDNFYTKYDVNDTRKMENIKTLFIFSDNIKNLHYREMKTRQENTNLYTRYKTQESNGLDKSGYLLEAFKRIQDSKLRELKASRRAAEMQEANTSADIAKLNGYLDGIHNYIIALANAREFNKLSSVMYQYRWEIDDIKRALNAAQDKTCKSLGSYKDRLNYADEAFKKIMEAGKEG